MSEIGGYFEIELGKGQQFHNKAIKLNSGRNSLLYIIRKRNIKSIYLPHYICQEVVKTISNASVSIKFYFIESDFMPKSIPALRSNEYFLYVNYFGLQSENITNLLTKIENLIIDNTQAFFSLPPNNIDTFYSPRKFFGVPDGGYLYTDTPLIVKLPLDKSYTRFQHLVKRVDMGAQSAYEIFKINEDRIAKLPLRRMSFLTRKLLSSINYKEVLEIRSRNFRHLNKYLKGINELKIEINKKYSSSAYPLLLTKEMLRERLIHKKVYVPHYWEDVTGRVNKTSFEYKLSKYLLPLPIDQRYSEHDMDEILERLNTIIDL